MRILLAICVGLVGCVMDETADVAPQCRHLQGTLTTYAKSGPAVMEAEPFWLCAAGARLNTNTGLAGSGTVDYDVGTLSWQTSDQSWSVRCDSWDAPCRVMMSNELVGGWGTLDSVRTCD